MTKVRYRHGLVIASYLAMFAGLLGSSPTSAASQTSGVRSSSSIAPGSEAENYLRYLQSIGGSKLTGMGIRELSISRSSLLFPTIANPWGARFDTARSSRKFLDFLVFPVSASAIGNSHFPGGRDDGAVWAGRGITIAADAGGMVRAGPVILQVNPVVFWAQNAAFELQNNARQGDQRFANGKPAFANSVDLPQRFGDGGYARADIGESELRVEMPWFRVGVSNAHRIWGPAVSYPFILGRNAPGFPHAFVSTNDGINIGFARFNSNILWGVLSQSEYSPVQGSETFFSLGESGTRRFASGIALSIQPRGVPGLEIGITRFIQSLWPQSGVPSAYFTKVFQNFLKSSLSEDGQQDPADLEGSDNQLLTGFVRWVLPKSGAEVYFEYGRDDHAYDFRDLVNEPDHARSYMIGGRKVLNHSATRLSAIRAEVISFALPATARHRDEGGIYAHAVIRQGHTQRGQLLGAPIGVGAASAANLAYERYLPSGSMSATWSRTVNQEAGAFFTTGVVNPSTMDVTHSLALERIFFRGPIDLRVGGTASRQFNRNFASDAVNFSVEVGGRYNIR